MCGICGIYHFERDKPIPFPVLERMAQALVHRGPDDSGFHVLDRIGLGHRRLSIIDVARGKQPLSNEDGSVWIVFNGEIYNHAELRRDLVARGHRFRSECDTEVIVHAYEEYGDPCVDHLNGMFAFAIWDMAQQRLFLARDRLGVKPLYYVRTGAAFLFASEIKALLEHPGVTRAVDLNAVPEYLFCTSFLDNRTMFRDVCTLAPGHTIVVDEHTETPKPRQYWDVAVPEPEDRGPAEHAERIATLLDDSVRLRLMSDVPFGSLLSGGLDSSFIAARATRHVHDRLKTFSMEFRDNVEMNRAQADVGFARIMAEHFDTDHHEFIFTPERYNECHEKATWHLEKPVELTTPSLFLLHQSLKPHVTVVLSGEGADEVFGGYFFFLKEAQQSELTQFPWAPFFSEVSQLLNPELAETTQFRSRVRQAIDDLLARSTATDFLNRVLYLFVKIYLLEMLERQDKTSMAWSVEARVPFLDHRLVEYAFTIPSRYKMRDGDEKFILKRACETLLPPAVRDRKKKPFPIPVDPRSVHRQRSVANDLVRDGSSRISQYFDKRKTESFLFKRNEFSNMDSLAVFRTSFALIALEQWHRAFRI